MKRFLFAIPALALAACASPMSPPPTTPAAPAAPIAPDGAITTAPPAPDTPSPEPTANDRQRLARLTEHRQSARARMNAEGDAQDAATVNALLDAPALPAAPEDIYGTWDCRVIKMGGKDFGLAVILYEPFECRITQTEGALRFRKTTGSQRTEGYLYRQDAKSWLYLGALRYAEDPPSEYGHGEESDQAARLYRIGEDHLRMEFPDPYYESEFDILELSK